MNTNSIHYHTAASKFRIGCKNMIKAGFSRVTDRNGLPEQKAKVATH